MKPTKTNSPAQSQDVENIPVIHPTSGGSWLRCEKTGALTKQQALPAVAAAEPDAPASPVPTPSPVSEADLKEA